MHNITILKVQPLSSIPLPVTTVCYSERSAQKKMLSHLSYNFMKKIGSTTELALRKLFWIMSSTLNFDIPCTISSLNVSVSLILIILELAFLQCFCANSFLCFLAL